MYLGICRCPLGKWMKVKVWKEVGEIERARSRILLEVLMLSGIIPLSIIEGSTYMMHIPQVKSSSTVRHRPSTPHLYPSHLPSSYRLTIGNTVYILSSIVSAFPLLFFF
ncbi:hypothetical protein F5Y02DRAFT_288908 [Annulohypoxylon stygium]|nr:hypothetical protein F5Y02DRAFT_288908 [Annulohypoxylon stygium]